MNEQAATHALRFSHRRRQRLRRGRAEGYVRLIEPDPQSWPFREPARPDLLARALAQAQD